MTDTAIALPTTHSLADLSQLAQQALDIEDALAALDAKTKAEKERLRILYEHTIPEVMRDVGVKAFTMRDGSSLIVESVTDASIPVANRPAAYEWLRGAGHGGLIKNEVSVSLGKDNDTLAAEVVTKLEQMGLTVERKESVHASTLKAFAKEMIREGKHLPLDLLGIFVGVRAKIKRPKE
jgi:hypothetical protein